MSMLARTMASIAVMCKNSLYTDPSKSVFRPAVAFYSVWPNSIEMMAITSSMSLEPSPFTSA